MTEYALYHQDDFIGIGTMQELADLIGVKYTTMSFYNRKSYKERKQYGYVLVDLGEKEDYE